MKAEWDDAPLRVRNKPNHAGLAISMIAACTMAVGLCYWAAPELTAQVAADLKRTALQVLNRGQEEPPPTYTPIEPAQSPPANVYQHESGITAEDMRIALENAQRYQQAQRASQSGRQTDFNNDNYQPRTDINTMESRHVTVASYRQNAPAQVRRVSNSGLNGTSQVTLKWRDARGRESRWPTTYTYRHSQIDNDSFCRNYGRGSIDYRTCRKAAKEWLNGRCGSGNRVQRGWQRMYCLAANGFRT
tara:strand:+ start:8737 stop:9474 length:738 start_codon:yes stop_codon:yes gene_type:complete